MSSPHLDLSEDAQAIAKEFKDYAYSVSHDLSAPVRGMVEFSKLLTDEYAEALNDEGKEYLHHIIESGHKLQAMMEGLLSYSRLNTLAQPFQQVSMNETLEQAQYLLKKKITDSGALIETEDLPVVQGDKGQLSILLSALIENAILFQPKDQQPKIKLSATSDQGFWVFSVADNGIGIENQFSERIFKLFQRLHTNAEYPGTGIGLTLAKKVAERHGGDVWIEPNQPQGSIVCFSLSQLQS